MTTNEPPPYPGEPTPPPNYGSAPPPPSSYPPPAEGGYPPPPGGGYPPPGGFPPAPGGYGAPPESNKKALWSMITGIVSLFCCGVILGPVAIVLSSQAKAEIAATGGVQSGEGQAKAGLILGIIGIIGWLAYLAVRFS